MVYLQSRELARGQYGGEIDLVLSYYSGAMITSFGLPETNIKQVITPASLRELGNRQEGEVLEESGAERGPLSKSAILRGRAPYLVLIREGNLEGVIDRMELAARIASTALQ